MATPLHRHQLVRLTDAGWREVQGRAWDDDDARACLAHWASRRLPLVVTRQQGLCGDGRGGGAGSGAGSGGRARDALALGLAAPCCWQRKRIALAVAPAHVAGFDEFPAIDAVAGGLPSRVRAAWRNLGIALAAVGATARVYGSHGWQCLTGLAYIHAESDVDLWIGVAAMDQADATAALLADFTVADTPRLDGELVFPDGRAVAWREWRSWRAGRCQAVLTKTLNGASLVTAW